MKKRYKEEKNNKKPHITKSKAKKGRNYKTKREREERRNISRKEKE